MQSLGAGTKRPGRGEARNGKGSGRMRVGWGGEEGGRERNKDKEEVEEVMR